MRVQFYSHLFNTPQSSIGFGANSKKPWLTQERVKIEAFLAVKLDEKLAEAKGKDVPVEPFVISQRDLAQQVSGLQEPGREWLVPAGNALASFQKKYPKYISTTKKQRESH